MKRKYFIIAVTATLLLTAVCLTACDDQQTKSTDPPANTQYTSMPTLEWGQLHNEAVNIMFELGPTASFDERVDYAYVRMAPGKSKEDLGPAKTLYRELSLNKDSSRFEWMNPQEQKVLLELRDNMPPYGDYLSLEALLVSLTNKYDVQPGTLLYASFDMVRGSFDLWTKQLQQHHDKRPLSTDSLGVLMDTGTGIMMGLLTGNAIIGSVFGAACSIAFVETNVECYGPDFIGPQQPPCGP